MHPILFQIGPVIIYTYGFLVFLGVLSGYFVCVRAARRQGIEKKTFSDIFFWVIVAAFLAARIVYVFVEFDSFQSDPFGVLFSRSGFVFYGGVIGAILALYFLSKRYKLGFLTLTDIFCLGVPLGHAFGRLGCFFYGCCYGRPTELLCGVRFPPDSPAGASGLKVLPVQLFEAGALLLIFAVLLALNRRKRFTGQIVLSYFLLYGITRFILEFFRGDFRGEVLFLSTSQFFSLVGVLAGVFLWKKWSRRRL